MLLVIFNRTRQNIHRQNYRLRKKTEELDRLQAALRNEIYLAGPNFYEQIEKIQNSIDFNAIDLSYLDKVLNITQK